MEHARHIGGAAGMQQICRRWPCDGTKNSVVGHVRLIGLVGVGAQPVCPKDRRREVLQLLHRQWLPSDCVVQQHHEHVRVNNSGRLDGCISEDALLEGSGGGLRAGSLGGDLRCQAQSCQKHKCPTACSDVWL